MTPTVHKIIAHSSDIIESTVLPVGYFGEERAKARNKVYKTDRLYHTRKSNRINNFTDVFHRAMDSSVPIISSVNLERSIRRQKKKQLPAEVLEMLSNAIKRLL